MRRFIRAASAAAVSGVLACSSSVTPLDLSGPAASLTKLSGDGQVGPAGAPLPQPLTVMVMDEAGLPVPARPVLWSVEAGTLSATVDSTDNEGRAAVVWTLPGQPGEYSAAASVAGLGLVTFTAEATPPAGSLVFRYLDAGSYHSCGIATTEELYCWGYNGDGQLGTEPSEPVLFPTPVPDPERFRTVTGGRYHTCGITLSGQPACWGKDMDGRLGEREFRVTYQLLQAGFVHTCGISLARELWCWGFNGEGQLNRNPVEVPFSATPCVVPRRNNPGDLEIPCGGARPPNGPRYKAVSVNGVHSCAIRENGQAECWGFGPEGQLGNGGTATSIDPVAVTGGLTFRTDPTIAPPAPDPDFPLPDGPFIAAGFAHTCAIGTDSRAYCWGLNQDGQLGAGGTTTSLVPVAVAGGQAFARITSGHRHTCAITAAGQAFCWGDNTFGQLGDGTTTDRLAPTAVSGGHAFAYIKAGELHTCGVTTTGVAHCWGNNEYGQLGNGTTNNSLLPAKVSFQP